MELWSLAPVWIVDFCGSAAMILVSAHCLYLVRRLFRKDPESPLANYLYWFFGAIFAFAASRSLGHMIKHLLYFSDNIDLWHHLAPISGSVNSMTFVVIASVTLFFHRMQTIMDRMNRDRARIEKTSQEILDLNKNIESIVFERTKKEMALRIAHELRNPIMIIGGLVRRLLSAVSDECMMEKERLEKVVEQARKLEAVVSGFEETRPGMEKKIAALELNGLLEEVLEIVEPEAHEKNITLFLDRSAVNLNMQGNEQQLKIAVMHIIRNAIEACEAGDSIQISTELTGRGIELKVRDDGPGIPPELLEHIYEPFYLTDTGETGLGIPYVKQILTEHKGSIAISSKEQAGTTVEITLPTHLGLLRERGPEYQI